MNFLSHLVLLRWLQASWIVQGIQTAGLKEPWPINIQKQVKIDNSHPLCISFPPRLRDWQRSYLRISESLTWEPWSSNAAMIIPLDLLVPKAKHPMALHSPPFIHTEYHPAVLSPAQISLKWKRNLQEVDCLGIVIQDRSQVSMGFWAQRSVKNRVLSW